MIRFLRCYNERKSLENAPNPGHRPKGVTMDLMNIIDAEMEVNDEMTSPELAQKRFEEFGIHIIT